MKNIAFKRAKVCPAVKESLHPEYIVEHADTSLFPVGFHKPEDGYEILSEDMFQEDLAKNPERHEEFLAKRREQEQAKIAAASAVATAQEAEDRKLAKEYEEFLRWKKNRGK